jgi:hypothetical protein
MREGQPMPKVTQLTVFLENRPGTLATLATMLGDSGVNIVDFLAGAVGAAGYVQLVVDDVAKAKDAFGRAGCIYAEQSVLYAEVANTPGALGALIRKLADRNINVRSAYATTMLGDRSTSVILAVSDLDAALTLE